MKGRVLITGASGFVGYHLVKEALELGLEVSAGIRPASNISHLKDLPVDFIHLNFEDIYGLCAILRKKNFDYVIHGAGLTKARTLEEYTRVNSDYTLNLACAVIESGISLKRFVFISSLAALGPVYEGGSITEKTQPAPVTAYGKSKLRAEEYLRNFSSLPLTIIRPTAVYGPREKDIFIMIRTIARGLELYLGRDKQDLSFIYVKDLAAAALKALEREDPGHAVYNIADGIKYDKYALANTIKSILKKKTFRFHLPLSWVRIITSALESAYRYSKNPPTLNKEKLNELCAPSWSCNIDLLKSELKFSPQYDLQKGLEESLKWYKENKWL